MNTGVCVKLYADHYGEPGRRAPGPGGRLLIRGGERASVASKIQVALAAKATLSRAPVENGSQGHSQSHQTAQAGKEGGV